MERLMFKLKLLIQFEVDARVMQTLSSAGNIILHRLYFMIQQSFYSTAAIKLNCLSVSNN